VFAGSGDVDDVRLEGLEAGGDLLAVAEEERIELEVLFHADGEWAATEFERAHVAGVVERSMLSALIERGADTEERQAMALRVGDEVAAGVGDSVDLVEGVREVGDTRGGGCERAWHDQDARGAGACRFGLCGYALLAICVRHTAPLPQVLRFALCECGAHGGCVVPGQA
jgi:hypothetical protein